MSRSSSLPSLREISTIPSHLPRAISSPVFFLLERRRHGGKWDELFVGQIHGRLVWSAVDRG
jgi:hypothetical protein